MPPSHRFREPEQTYFERRAREEQAAANAARDASAERSHRELANSDAARAAAVEEARRQLGTDY